MFTEKERNGGKIVMVVLDGLKLTTEKNGGSAPLRLALRDYVVGQKDEVLVLTIFSSQQPPTPSPSNGGYCCLRDSKSCPPSSAGEGYSYIKFLHGEISRRTQAYTDIFRPFYNKCKSSGVKFEVRIAAGFQPKAIIVQQANYAAADWIVMDRCLAESNSFQLSAINCTTTSLVLVSDAEVGLHNCTPPNDQPEASTLREVLDKFDNLKLKTKEEPHIYCPFQQSDLASTSKQGEISEKTEMAVADNSCSGDFSKLNDIAVGIMSLELSSLEVISDITSEFKNIFCDNQTENFQMFRGYLPDHQSEILVKKFTGDFSGVLEAEKTVALSMHHKNIMSLIGYHQNTDAVSLVFPNTIRGTLERFLYGARGIQGHLTFHDKMKIAIGVGQGLRYMHEEYQHGPVVHGDLQISNIFLQYNLQPLITGFGLATWLRRDQSSPTFNSRCWHEYHSDPEALKLVKADILSFGILLLRLVCRKSIPHDNRLLIKWARPLLLERAYHEMLDEDEQYPDMYGIFRAMCAAAQCIKSRHTSRPCMSEVVSFLKGETSGNAQSSPIWSEGSSPSINLSSMSSIIRC